MSGPTDGVTCARLPSGTETPSRPVRCSRFIAERSRWYWGSSSITTQYWSFGRVDGADLPRAVRVVERVLDLVDVDAERRGPVAVDADLDLRVLDLQVAGDVGEPRDVVQPLLERGGALVQGVDVGALQGELVQALGLSGRRC